jgi:hypothetical protein
MYAMFTSGEVWDRRRIVAERRRKLDRIHAVSIPLE